MFNFMMRRIIQISISMCRFPVNVDDSNTIFPGNQGVQERDLSIIFFFDSKSDFWVNGI